MKSDLRISRNLVIPADELKWRFSTSGGPGGQHANKAATRAELRWDVAGSRALGPRQRARLLSKLAHRLDARGVLLVTSDSQRSQLQNRQAAQERLAELVGRALRVEKARVGTKPSRRATEQRLQRKKKRAEIKRLRRGPRVED